MKKLSFIVIIIVSSVLSFAQKPNLEFTEIKDENGTSFYDVSKIEQDAFGFLWFVKYANGMYRYDGNGVAAYKYNPNDSLTVQTHLKSFFFGENGSFLISSDTSVIDFFALRNRTKSPYQTLIDSSFSFFKIIEDYKGNLWIQKSTNLYKYDSKTHKLKTYTKEYPRKYFDFINSGNQDKTITELVNITDNQDTSINFTIEKDKKIIIACSGEGTYKMSDYGIIIHNNDTIWKMTRNESIGAGGAYKNRIEIKVIDLKKGEYTLKYKTDDSHSYNNWNAAPPSKINFYGCKLFDFDNIFNDYDKKVNDLKFSNVLAITNNYNKKLCVLTTKGIYVQQNVHAHGMSH